MRLPRDNRGTWLAAAVLAVVAVIVVGIAIYEATKTKNVSNPNVAFVNTDTTSTKAVAKPGKKFVWPLYGLNAARTRDFQGPADLKPPFKVAWKLSGNGPLEFPPVIDGNTMYFMDDNGSVNKVNAITGKRLWRKSIGTWSAATPALDVKLGLMFVPVLSISGHSPGNGRFVAMSMSSGKIKWSYPLSAGSESSPIIVGNNVYFGDAAGTVRDLNVRTGREVWSFPTGGPEKGGPTYHDGDLYFGNYSGQVYAVNAKTGKQVWESNVGPGIYASPTYAYGRLYFGSTGGQFYSLSATTGVEAWSISTGSYVYSSAAVADTPGLGPTVYFGSYSGDAYAVNAHTGTVDWTHDIGDSISGAASIVNNVVFFSGVYHGDTEGLNMKNGDVVFTYPDGAYTATVATPRAVYLLGHYTLYELLPKKR
jgi:outer membrane protein assembly factor BamB